LARSTTPLFLAGQAAGWITDQALSVDGGYLLI
jgi:hypothetical protein